MKHLQSSKIWPHWPLASWALREPRAHGPQAPKALRSARSDSPGTSWRLLWRASSPPRGACRPARALTECLEASGGGQTEAPRARRPASAGPACSAKVAHRSEMMAQHWTGRKPRGRSSAVARSGRAAPPVQWQSPTSSSGRPASSMRTRLRPCSARPGSLRSWEQDPLPLAQCWSWRQLRCVRCGFPQLPRGKQPAARKSWPVGSSASTPLSRR
mmetsp:Transcript_68334/g.160192  ORF Transcript_68334/g.160192 Transcript_68334/m.160192 type:complete len:215 (+) Transcript_68334:55-699(+)